MTSHHRDFPEEMSHEIAIVIMSYDSRVILLTNQKLTHKLKFWLKIWFWFWLKSWFWFWFNNLTIQRKMPSLDELTTRFEATCERIQDSIRVIESHMGAKEEFTFDINRAVYTLEDIDISQAESDVDNFTMVFQEYKKILRMEKGRRRLQMEIKKNNETKTFKLELKKTRQGRKLASNPYAKKERETQ